MEKKYVIGVDPGIASLGLFLRDTEQDELLEQIKFASVDIVRAGVNDSGQNKYLSFAAERRRYRTARSRFLHRKWRKQETLKLLIDECILEGHIKHLLCPLSYEELERWIRYDKAKGYKREYPVYSTSFAQWIMMDFDGDGKVDGYSSPYQIRKELMERQFDFSNPEDCFKLGRALYHIAQRRGFKSSKGSSLKDDELPEDENDMNAEDFDAMEYSEQKKSKSLTEYMDAHHLKTVGCALAALENEGVRLRDSDYQAIRKQYKEEVKAIFEFQEQLSTDSFLYKRLMSEKKGSGTIFYQLPLRSQKGNVERCSLDPLRKRCKASHPEFEKYRVWSFINNIRIKLPEDGQPHQLPLDVRERLYAKISGTVSKNFDFVSIRRWIEKDLGLRQELSAKDRTINFYDDYSVSGCPTIGRLKRILGDEWEAWVMETEHTRTKKNGTKHHVVYRAENLWHVCDNAEDESFVADFARKLHFDDTQTIELVRLFKNASDEYASLSLSTLKKINRFLVRGFNNYESTLLANIPTLIGPKLWKEHAEEIEFHLQDIIDSNREKKRFVAIANKLIADYFSLDEHDRFAEHNPDYQLQESDLADVEQKIAESVGRQTWAKMPQDEQEAFFSQVASLYQQFFASTKRTYLPMPTDMDSISEYLSVAFGIALDGKENQLYTPYDNQYYPKAVQTKGGCFQLCSPVKGALRNPSAMRIMHLIKRRINALLKDASLGITAENTRVVVELPRDLNDINMRKAIEKYQNRREKENNIFRSLIKEMSDDEEERLQKTRLLIEQSPEYVLADFNEKLQKNKTYNEKVDYATTKYRLWLEQNCIDLYTGRPIPFSKLFDNDQYDIEHTIPRSIALEDCLENKTITSASFNRKVKGNLIPTQLANYETVVLPNLKPWQERVERLEGRVKYWLKETKKAATPERKDFCIVQRHLWQMELDYWRSKLERFTITEVTSDFVKKHMSDTRVISKYVFHYLKSFFPRVDMQYGSTTATFRKIYGLPAKDRSNHTHHVVDAAVLSFIPSSASRDTMLRLFYQIDEEKRSGHIQETNRLRAELEREKNLNLYGSKYAKATGSRVIDVVNQLRETILVNHVQKDQTLTPARKRGTIKKNGQRIKILKTGDSLRGRIHKESFFGAIKPWATDSDGHILRDSEGQPIVEDIKYVKRCKLIFKQGLGDGFTDWEDLEKRIVDKALFKKLKEQADGLSFKEACAAGFFVVRSINGNLVKNRIRHVRCLIDSKLSHLPTKKHVFLSDKEYKQYYYAESADLPYACEYRGEKETSFLLFSLYDIALNRKQGIDDIPQTVMGKKEVLRLERVITKGDMVMLYRDTPEELNSLDEREKSRRLYKVDGFEKPNRINLTKHLLAIKTERGKSSNDFEAMISEVRFRMSLTKIKFVLYKP